MAGEWEETTLGAEVDLLTGFPFKSERYTDSADSIPLVRGDNIVQGAMRWDGVKRWPLSDREQHALYELREGDVVLAMDRPWIEAGLKYAAISKHDLPCLLVQRTARLRGGPKLDTRFLRYLIGSREFTQHIHAITTGTAVPHISGKQIKDFTFTLPPLAEQKAIAAVLGALDDKIELNRRMNATLEAMARALFQSWFVDFDPVRLRLNYDGQVRPTQENPTGLPAEALAKAGLDPATAALFPASFQDSPIGHIPTGWEVSTIGAKLSTALGGTPSRANADYWTDGTVPWINSGKTNEFRIIDPSEWITKEALANSATKLLPKRTTVLAITGATLGQVSITEIECCANQSVVAILASNEFPTEFIYPWIEENIEKLVASQTGGAQQHINKGNVEELVLLCPDQRVVREYVNKAKPLFDQIAANCFQSRTLANLRDTLLPKLLSGELSVNESNAVAS